MSKKNKIIMASALAAVLIVAVVLALVLTLETYTVTFETNGGSKMESITGIKKDSKLTRPANPTKLDYVLEGWYTDAELTKLWLFDMNKVTGNLKLYAKWKIAYSNNLSYTLNADNTYTVSAGTTKDENVILPHYYQGIKVARIANNAFSGYSTIKSVKISNTITTIGDHAFFRCVNLQTVTLPQELQSIEAYAFGSCEKLENVVFPVGLKKIGDQAFADCKGLTEINLPEGLEDLGTYAFRNCTGLTSVELPNSVQTVYPYLFSGCSDLTSLTLGANVSKLETNALYGCQSLTQIIYKGTKSQWEKIWENSIIKTDWKGNSPIEKVVCADGEVLP